MTRTLIDDPKQAYFLYVPKEGMKACSVFVTVHGVQRMASEHAGAFVPFAERHGAVIVAPLFPKDRFRDYQRLGLQGNGIRADVMLNRIIDEVGFLTGADIHDLFMFGYSGGGQFVHRYAMAYPYKPKRIVVAASGWYTFPDHKVPYPLGVKRVRGLVDVSFEPAHFLSIPACVMVGGKDVHRDAELKKSKRVDRQQGVNRLQRGETWIRAMKSAAEFYNLDTEFSFQVLTGCGHSFLECMHRSRMGARVFEFLFGSF